jgi:hypothetical protein
MTFKTNNHSQPFERLIMREFVIKNVVVIVVKATNCKKKIMSYSEALLLVAAADYAKK